MIVTLREWLCVQRCLADIELVRATTPVRRQAASSLIVCPNVKSIGSRENDFDVRFKEKHPLRKSL